jgi:uncharacterized protein YwgA
MTSAAELIPEILSLNGGIVKGKTRFQKSVYFLETHSLGYGFEFDYHHYGPYSEELSIAASDAKALELIEIRWEHSQSGVSFAVYSNRDEPDRRLPHREHDGARQALLAVLKRYDSVVLELAATADFLSKRGYAEDPWKETLERKASKATPPRIAEAKKLLEELRAF